MEWKTYRKRGRHKIKNPPEGKKEAIKARPRPDAIIVETGSATYAKTLKAMKAKVDSNFAAGNFNKVKETRSGELLIEFQKGKKLAEVRDGMAAAPGDETMVRELDQSVALDIRDIDLETTREEVAKAVIDAPPDDNGGEVKVRA